MDQSGRVEDFRSPARSLSGFDRCRDARIEASNIFPRPPRYSPLAPRLTPVRRWVALVACPPAASSRGALVDKPPGPPGRAQGDPSDRWVRLALCPACHWVRLAPHGG